MGGHGRKSDVFYFGTPYLIEIQDSLKNFFNTFRRQLPILQHRIYVRMTLKTSNVFIDIIKLECAQIYKFRLDASCKKTITHSVY